MQREYAYIKVGASSIQSSEASVKAWLERVVGNSGLEPVAKALITTQSMIPVEISILEEGDDPHRAALIVERVEMRLWHILDRRIGWQADVGKNHQSDSVQIKVLFPSFYGALASRLTASRYFLESLKPSGQARSESWVKYDLDIASRPLLKTETVLLSVWSTSRRELAEIWFDLPLISLGAEQWPKAISTAWPGMRIGARTGNTIRYSSSPGNNALWVKPFGEPVWDATISIVPRWTARPLELPGEALKADEVIVVALRGMPFEQDEVRYVIEVPASQRATLHWQYYVSAYVSYRNPWINCGVLQGDGGIQLKRGQANAWFVRCDAGRLLIDVTVVPRELTGWKDVLASSLPVAASTRVWQQWDDLMASVDRGNVTQDYFKALIDRCLAKSGLPQETQSRLKQEQRFRYKYVMGFAAFSPGASAFNSSRYKYFSFEQVLLGEPQRRAYFQEKVIAVHALGNDLPAAHVSALAGLRDRLLAEFHADIDALAANADYTKLFTETCSALARVRVARYLTQNHEVDQDLQECAYRFLKGELKLRLLSFKDALVPNVVVLKFNSQKALLLSVNITDTKWGVWEPCAAAGQPSPTLMQFIKEHLPFPQRMNDELLEFCPKVKRYGYHYRRTPEEPIAFREALDVYEELRMAAIGEIKAQIDYAVFSSDEERRRAMLGMYKSVARAVAGLVTAALGPLSGLGSLLFSGLARFIANVADIGLTYALAQQADRPADYNAYIRECKLGVLLTMVDLSADRVTSDARLRVLLKQSTLATRASTPGFLAPNYDDSPIKLEQTGQSALFLATETWMEGVRERMESTFADASKSAELKGYLQASTTRGYAESKACSDFLRSRQWSTQAVGVLIFSELNDQHPETHFALSIQDEADTAIVDLSLGQLDASMTGRGYVGSPQGWQECLSNLPALRGKLVIYKFYSHFAQASLEVDSVFALGISWNPFVRGGDYSVLSFPSRFIAGVQQQLARLWSAVFLQLPGNESFTLDNAATFSQSQLLNQLSNLTGLIDSGEGLLRRTIGVEATGELRSMMLGYFQTGLNGSLEGYRELMAWVIAEESELVKQAMVHLEALQAGLPSTGSTALNAIEDCVDWIAVRAGNEDETWRALLKQQLELYVSGSRATDALHSAAVVHQLYEQLARGQEKQRHHQRGLIYERLTPISARALLSKGLLTIRDIAQERQAECYFALIMTSQPFEDSNEHFSRILYSICALRQQRFTVLTPLHERRLSGLESADSILV